MEAIIEKVKKLSLDKDTIYFDKETYIIPLTINVSFYTGWSWILSESKKIKTNKQLEVDVLMMKQGIVYIRTKEPEFFSWSNGPTLPNRYYTLFSDGTLGYIQNDLVQRWSHNAPTWSYVE